MRISRERLGFWILAAVVGIIVGSCRSSHDRKNLGVENDTWLFTYDTADVGVRGNWFADSCDRSNWETRGSGYWDDEDSENYDGVAWYASTFQLSDTSRPYSLYVGGVDDEAVVWVNGIPIGTHTEYDEPFAFELPSVHAGRNSVVIRVTDLGGPGGLYKPVQIVQTSEVKKLLISKFAGKVARQSPDWVRDGVIYEVYLRSFSKDGTFKGLESRLAELKDLGVTVVWLMPIHPVGSLARKGRLGSPYSVQDYYEINPEFGTLEDFRSLVASVHRLGMKIIIDLVANHASWDSHLLEEHTDWFKTNSEGAIVSPNADWTDVAQLDYRKHELRKYMIAMMEYWVRDLHIDGYRCDVADLLPLDFWEIARMQLDKIKPVVMLAEGKRPEDHMQAFDLTYSWNVYDVLADVVHGKRTVNALDQILTREGLEYPKNSLRLRFDTNHDKTAKDGPPVLRYSVAGARATAVLLFTYPGVPLVYNGEEVGNSKRLDLFEKVAIDWSKGKECRNLFSALARIRSQHRALIEGGYEKIWCSDSARTFAFDRVAGVDRVSVVINFSDERKEIAIKATKPMSDCLSGKEIASDGTNMKFVLAPYGAVILVPREEGISQ